jgi:hypothetical protein
MVDCHGSLDPWRRWEGRRYSRESGSLTARNRHVERVFNPDRKDTHWGKRSWRGIGKILGSDNWTLSLVEVRRICAAAPVTRNGLAKGPVVLNDLFLGGSY